MSLMPGEGGQTRGFVTHFLRTRVKVFVTSWATLKTEPWNAWQANKQVSLKSTEHGKVRKHGKVAVGEYIRRRPGQIFQLCCSKQALLNRETFGCERSLTRMDLLTTPAMARPVRKPDQPQWDQPKCQCPFCLDVELFRSHEGRRRNRHLRETHSRIMVWRCPYCPMWKHSHHFDDLRSHVWAVLISTAKLCILLRHPWSLWTGRKRGRRGQGPTHRTDR